MKEATVARAVDRILKNRGAYTVNIHGTGTTRNGIADRLACYHGRFLALELKAPGGRPTPLQRHELDQAAAGGAITAIVDDPRQLTALLDAVDRTSCTDTLAAPRKCPAGVDSPRGTAAGDPDPLMHPEDTAHRAGQPTGPA